MHQTPRAFSNVKSLQCLLPRRRRHRSTSLKVKSRKFISLGNNLNPSTESINFREVNLKVRTRPSLISIKKLFEKHILTCFGIEISMTSCKACQAELYKALNSTLPNHITNMIARDARLKKKLYIYNLWTCVTQMKLVNEIFGKWVYLFKILHIFWIFIYFLITKCKIIMNIFLLNVITVVYWVLVYFIWKLS